VAPSCVHGANVNLVILSVQTNRLGWDNFLEGRLSSHWLTVAAPLFWQGYGPNTCYHLHGDAYSLLNCTMLSTSSGCTGTPISILREATGWWCRSSMISSTAYMLINCDTLLPQHRLLFETDFEALSSGPASHHLLWLADMDLGLAASSLSQLGSLTPTAQAFFSAPSPPWSDWVVGLLWVSPGNSSVLHLKGTLLMDGGQCLVSPGLVGQLRFPSVGFQGVRNTVDMSPCYGCSCPLAGKNYVCPSKVLFWPLDHSRCPFIYLFS
jgi:hypothetical protein